jgi:NAD(P)-dependent dehydrogenase (short-subunit alcohol dehydrogenase family)
MTVLDRFRLDGDTAVVTGGDRGIGNAIATGFAEAGANVVIANRDGAAGEAAAADLATETGAETLAVETDVTDEGQVESMVERAVEAFDSLDVLVNNAGIVVHEAAEEMTREAFESVLETNLTGVFLCSRAAVDPLSAGEGDGRIVSVSSMSARVANYPQRQVGYNASKAGIEGFTRQLASEWAERGIRVNAVAPGYVATEMAEQGFREHPDWADTWRGETLLGEFADPEDVTPVVLLLASEASAYMTGAVVTVDGGYTVR